MNRVGICHYCSNSAPTTFIEIERPNPLRTESPYVGWCTKCQKTTEISGHYSPLCECTVCEKKRVFYKKNTRNDDGGRGNTTNPESQTNEGGIGSNVRENPQTEWLDENPYSDADDNPTDHWGFAPRGQYEGDRHPGAVFKCRNCGDDDPFLVFFDEHQWKYVSRCCGLVTDDDPVPPSDPRVAVAVGHVARSTYERGTHVAERLRMDCYGEPAISTDHLDLIREGVRSWRAKSGSDVRTKADVQQVLRLMNSEPMYGGRFWTKKYLEKWKTILNDVCGVYYEPLSAEQREIVLAVFVALSQKWQQLQREDHAIQHNRKHFPNFNVTIRRIMDMYEIPYYASCWPIPSKKCVIQSNQILNFLFHELNK